MAVADLLKDARLVSTSKDASLRGLTRDFVLRRVRMLVQLNPADADPSRPGEITAAATVALGNVIAREIPDVAAASDSILARVANDRAHLPLDPATRRRRGIPPPPLDVKNARGNRFRVVRAIVYQAAAENITLAEPANLERLHRLVDRRLRMMERMVYDVGRAGLRAWSLQQINTHPGGPWLDGYERLFEYPRVPTWAFLSACRPGQGSQCSPPMQRWSHFPGSVSLGTRISANAAAGAAWTNNGPFKLDFAPAAGVPAVTAIQRMFQPSTDFLARGLMNCDHLIHALHIEALEFSKTKRNAGTAWLDAEVASQPPRWLRIQAQFDKSSPGPYLGSLEKNVFFEHVSVREADLQVGDHLIIYNHPAYRRTSDGVWQLENAVVVQTLPTLMMQGHGSPLLTKGGMWQVMIDIFHGELKRRRAEVLGLCRILGFGNNTLTVNDPRFLARGLKIDIVRDDPGEAVLAQARTIVAISGRTIRYDGPSVSAATPHRLRRARTRLFDQAFEGIDGSAFLLVRRTAPAASQYAPGLQHADWFIAWVVDEDDEEIAIRKDPVRAAFVKERHLIEYTQERIDSTLKTVGWFPLWKPSKTGGVERRKNGKITAVEEVRIKQPDVAGWTWFFDPDPKKRDRVPVIRPREL